METNICKLKFRRGNEDQRTKIVPDEGEPIWTLDTHRLCIGDGKREGGVPLARIITTDDISTVTGAVTGDIAVVKDSQIQVYGNSGWTIVAGATGLTSGEAITISENDVISVKYDDTTLNVTSNRLTVKLGTEGAAAAHNELLKTNKIVDTNTNSITQLSAIRINNGVAPLAMSVQMLSTGTGTGIPTIATVSNSTFKSNWNDGDNNGDIYDVTFKFSGSDNELKAEKLFVQPSQCMQLLYDTNQFTTATTMVSGIYSNDQGFCVSSPGLSDDGKTLTYTVSAGASKAQMLQINEEYIKKVIKENSQSIALDTVYPVGSIYMTVAHRTVEDVKNALGGNWEKLPSGRMLVSEGTLTQTIKNGAGTNVTVASTFKIGESGGELAHGLTIDEMPSHSHLLFGTYAGTGASTVASNTYPSIGGGVESGNGGWSNYIIAGTGHSPTAGLSQYVGGSQLHNNVPPYYTVYMYKRIQD